MSGQANPDVKYHEEKCPECNGEGILTVEEQIDVDQFRSLEPVQCHVCRGEEQVITQAYVDIVVRVTLPMDPKERSQDHLATIEEAEEAIRAAFVDAPSYGPKVSVLGPFHEVISDRLSNTGWTGSGLNEAGKYFEKVNGSEQARPIDKNQAA